MARGVDVTSLDLVPMDASNSDDGYRGLLIKYTCRKDLTRTLANVKYNQPDQISVVSEIPAGSMDSSVSVVKTANDARNSLSVNAGVDAATPKVAFSASFSYEKMQSTLLQKSRKVETVSNAYGARRVDMVTKDTLKLSLDTGVKALIAKLPSSYTDNPAAYRDFIKTYGTHYFVMAKFGGTLTMFLETSADYYEKNELTKIEVQAKATFLSAVSAYGGVSTSTATIDAKFTENSLKTVRYYGGTANLLAQTGLAAWQPTIQAQPWLFSSTLAPISDLIQDNMRSSAMRKAINDHVLRAYLTVELKRIINSLPSVPRASTTAVSLLATIDTMNKQVPLVEAEVLALGTEVNGAFIDLMLQYYSTLETLTWANTYDQPLNFECPAGQSITRTESRHNNFYEDREFAFGCSYAPKMTPLVNCAWTDYVNNYDGDMNYICPGNGVMKGWNSVHNNYYEDRQFKFLCCNVEGFSVNPTCSWTDYLNDFDKNVAYRVPSSKAVISGVHSVHHNFFEDRRWKLYVCTYSV